MAVEREIPKDINKYEAKFVGPFTARQTVCIVPAVVLGVGAGLLFKDLLPRDACIVIGVLLASPWLLCGWVKLGGLPFEKFIQTAFISTVLAPKHRVYKTENIYEKAFKDKELPTKIKKQKEKKAQNYISKNPQLKAYK